MDVTTITLKELRPKLPHVIRDVDEKLGRYIITKRGKPMAVMMSVDDYEGLVETLNILTDKGMLPKLKKAEQEIREGQFRSLNEIRKDLERV